MVREARGPEGPPEVSGRKGRGAGVAPVPAAPWGPRPAWFGPQRPPLMNALCEANCIFAFNLLKMLAEEDHS